jgi:hypothetical protein
MPCKVPLLDKRENRYMATFDQYAEILETLNSHLWPEMDIRSKSVSSRLSEKAHLYRQITV